MKLFKFASRKSILILGDVVLLVLGLYIAAYLTETSFVDFKNLIYEYDCLIWLVVSSAWFFITINGLLTLHKMSFTHLLVGTAITVIQLITTTVIGSYLLYPGNFSGKFFLVMAIVQFVMILGWEYLFWQYDVNRYFSSRLLVVGPKDFCHSLQERFSHYTQHICRIDYWDYDEKGLPEESILMRYDSILVSNHLKLQDKKTIALHSHELGLKVSIKPGILDLYWVNAEFDKIDDMPVFRLKAIEPSTDTFRGKRMMDILLSGIGLILCMPLFVIVAVLIKLDSSGSVLYTQTRSGQKEKPFKIYKFRSMVNDAEKRTGAVLCSQNDARITRLGKFLRATRIDELPQLFNVFIGDMSLVGPRPERPEFVEKFKRTIPHYTTRHCVKPGITGLAQIKGKYNTSVEDKLVYDLLYIHSCSVISDIVLILQTFKVLFIKESTQGVKPERRSKIENISLTFDERSRI